MYKYSMNLQNTSLGHDPKFQTSSPKIQEESRYARETKHTTIETEKRVAVHEVIDEMEYDTSNHQSDIKYCWVKELEAKVRYKDG